MCRISSPGTYSRCSANSTLKPWYGLRWSPEMNPSTMSRAFTSSRAIFERNLGSRYFLGSEDFGGSCILQARGCMDRRVGKETVDDGARRHALGLGAEVRQDPVPQHRVGHRLDVIRRHIASAVQDRPRFAAQDEELRRTG